MNLIVTLIIGGVLGWLASIVMKTNAQMGLIANIVVGVVGAWLGGWLAGSDGHRFAGHRHLHRVGGRGRDPDCDTQGAGIFK